MAVRQALENQLRSTISGAGRGPGSEAEQEEEGRARRRQGSARVSGRVGREARQPDLPLTVNEDPAHSRRQHRAGFRPLVGREQAWAVVVRGGQHAVNRPETQRADYPELMLAHVKTSAPRRRLCTVRETACAGHRFSQDWQFGLRTDQESRMACATRPGFSPASPGGFKRPESGKGSSQPSPLSLPPPHP